MHRQNMMGLHPMRDESISHVPANAIQNQNKQITVIKEFIDGYCNVSLDYDHTFIKKFEVSLVLSIFFYYI